MKNTAKFVDTFTVIVSDVAIAQGGVALGPVKLSAGLGAGR